MRSKGEKKKRGEVMGALREGKRGNSNEGKIRCSPILVGPTLSINIDSSKKIS